MKKFLLLAVSLAYCMLAAVAQPFSASLKLKIPGNAAQTYELVLQGNSWRASQLLPVNVTQTMIEVSPTIKTLTLTLQAKETVWFHFSECLQTPINHASALFCMPG